MMATCKECFHYEACVLNEAYWVKHNADQACSEFKDKTKYVEQKHGEWNHKGAWHIECLECHYILAHIGEAKNYCPNCGAKMDGEI